MERPRCGVEQQVGDPRVGAVSGKRGEVGQRPRPDDKRGAILFSKRGQRFPVIGGRRVDQRPILPCCRKGRLKGWRVVGYQHKRKTGSAAGEVHGLCEPVGVPALVSHRHTVEDEVLTHTLDDRLPHLLHHGSHLIIRPGVGDLHHDPGRVVEGLLVPEHDKLLADRDRSLA
ncbi:MAG TPA: hypothetical protein PKK41_02745, partial [Methanoculleus sp.]|nr:hypothetical protein [Methanoculleus sp.]